MASNEQTLDLIAELSEIPSKYKDRNEVLQRITELGQRAMGSLACTLASVDLKSKQMKHIACASTNKEFERYMTGHEFDIGTGTWVQFDLIEKGDVVERHELQDDGQGVADPKVARKYGLTSLVGYPLHFDEELFGYINFFSNDVRQFSSAEKQLMMILARQAGIAIEKFHSQKIVAVLKDLSRRLVLKSPQDFLREVCEKVCELFSVPVCIIWRLDARTEQLAIEAASSGVDDDYRKLTLAQADKRVSNHLNRKGLSYLPNVTEARSKYVHSEAAQMRGWKSLLSAPMWAENRKFGFLDIYAREKRHYTALEKKQFQYFADHVALSFQKSELLKEAEYGKRLGKLMEIMLQIAEATNKKEVLRLLLRGSLELVEKKDGLIRLLNYQTGILEIEQLEEDEVLQTPEVGISQGITGLALSKEAPIKVDDITGAEWKDVYIKHFKNMRSELAIPILIRKASIRVGKEVKFGTKPIGVLNIESPEIGAFSEADKKCLWSLARYAAIIVETLEYDDKLAKLRKLGEKLTKIEDYGGAIKVILEAIKSILAFEYINVSVIVPERNWALLHESERVAAAAETW